MRACYLVEFFVTATLYVWKSDHTQHGPRQSRAGGFSSAYEQIYDCHLDLLTYTAVSAHSSVRENVCNNSKNVKNHVFLDFEKKTSVQFHMGVRT